MNTHACRKTLLLLAVTAAAAVAVFPAAAQGQPLGSGGSGGFMFGMHWLQVSELNDDLRANGLATFSSLHYTYGGGGYGIIGGRFIVGGEGHGFSQEASTADYVQRLSGGFGFFNIGYILLEQWGVRFFPLAGIGGGGLTLRISQIANHTWEDIIDPTSFEEVQVSTGGFLAHVGAGLDYRLKLGEDEEGEGGLLLGVRAGYTVPFSQADWSMGSQDVIGGPNIGVEGLYLRFVIGGWGREKGR